MKKTIILVTILTLSFIAGRLLSVYAHSIKENKKTDSAPITIVIDPGHGGFDPGKICNEKIFEKDINLSIALKLKDLFKQKGYKVILTRSKDTDLSSNNSENSKSEDMINRTKIINQANATLFISIHQNSFPDNSSSGPQVFYYSDSTSSKTAASCLQKELNKVALSEKTRDIKSNSDYYLLKKSVIPGIIVECGFLSNPVESELLQTDAYQTRISRLIYIGTIKYLKSELLH